MNDVLVQQLRLMRPCEPVGHWGRLAADEIERLQAFAGRQESALAAARRELLMYAGEGKEDWDDGTADAMAQIQAAEKARTP